MDLRSSFDWNNCRASTISRSTKQNRRRKCSAPTAWPRTHLKGCRSAWFGEMHLARIALMHRLQSSRRSRLQSRPPMCADAGERLARAATQAEHQARRPVPGDTPSPLARMAAQDLRSLLGQLPVRVSAKVHQDPIKPLMATKLKARSPGRTARFFRSAPDRRYLPKSQYCSERGVPSGSTAL